MTPLAALQQVYSRGERCLLCDYHSAALEYERLSGRGTVRLSYRVCEILESQNYNFPREPWDCPGVAELMNKENEDAPG